MERTAHRDAVDVGQSEIEDDEVDDRFRSGPLDAGESGCRPFGKVPVGLERTNEAFCDAVIVFDDQDPLGDVLVSHTGEGTAHVAIPDCSRSDFSRFGTDFTLR